jgi:hypothetical protein
MADEIKTESKPKNERFEVAQHKVFEIAGSTITFRPNQVLSDPREIAIARENGVALRPLSQVR